MPAQSSMETMSLGEAANEPAGLRCRSLPEPDSGGVTVVDLVLWAVEVSGGGACGGFLGVGASSGGRGGGKGCAGSGGLGEGGVVLGSLRGFLVGGMMGVGSFGSGGDWTAPSLGLGIGRRCP